MPIPALVGAALVGAAASGAQSLYQSSQIQGANKQTRKFAREVRAWEEMMANTAHQREAADLEAAGLNRILSGTGGAGSAVPGAPMATATPAIGSADVAHGAASAVQAKLAMEMQEKQKELIEAQTAKTEDEAEGVREDTALKRLQRGFEEGWYTDPATGEVKLNADEGGMTLRRKGMVADLTGKGISQQFSRDQITNLRQLTANLVQQHNIGQSAEAQAKILTDIYRSDPGALLKLLSILKDLIK